MGEAVDIVVGCLMGAGTAINCKLRIKRISMPSKIREDVLRLLLYRGLTSAFSKLGIRRFPFWKSFYNDVSVFRSFKLAIHANNNDRTYHTFVFLSLQ